MAHLGYFTSSGKKISKSESEKRFPKKSSSSKKTIVVGAEISDSGNIVASTQKNIGKDLSESTKQQISKFASENKGIEKATLIHEKTPGSGSGVSNTVKISASTSKSHLVGVEDSVAMQSSEVKQSLATSSPKSSSPNQSTPESTFFYEDAKGSVSAVKGGRERTVSYDQPKNTASTSKSKESKQMSQEDFDFLQERSDKIIDRTTNDQRLSRKVRDLVEKRVGTTYEMRQLPFNEKPEEVQTFGLVAGNLLAAPFEFGEALAGAADKSAFLVQSSNRQGFKETSRLAAGEAHKVIPAILSSFDTNTIQGRANAMTLPIELLFGAKGARGARTAAAKASDNVLVALDPKGVKVEVKPSRAGYTVKPHTRTTITTTKPSTGDYFQVGDYFATQKPVKGYTVKPFKSTGETITIQTSKGEKVLNLAGGVDSTAESLQTQVARAGETTTPVSASTGLFNKVGDEVFVDKPLPKKNSPELERALFADPDLNVRASRLGLSEGNLFDLLFGDAKAGDVNPQILVWPDEVLAKFPAKLSDVKKSLSKGKQLSASQKKRLLKFQMTEPEQFTVPGFISKESEVTLSPGATVTAVDRVATVLINNRRVKIFETAIKKADDGVLLKVTDDVDAIAAKLVDDTRTISSSQSKIYTSGRAADDFSSLRTVSRRSRSRSSPSSSPTSPKSSPSSSLSSPSSSKSSPSSSLSSPSSLSNSPSSLSPSAGSSGSASSSQPPYSARSSSPISSSLSPIRSSVVSRPPVRTPSPSFKSERNQLFDVFVGRKGRQNFEQLVFEGGASDAFEFGKQQTRQSLAASFRVVDKSTGQDVIGSLGADFRRGKGKDAFIVQRRSKRLSTRSEVGKITKAKKSTELFR